MNTVVQKFVIQNQIGLHARPAARFVQLVTSFATAHVWIQNISRQSERVSANSLIMVLSISALQNDEVEITVQSDHPEAVMQEIGAFFNRKSGEIE